MGSNCFLVTGAQGCIGSWVIKNLLDMVHEVIALDVHTRPVRLSLLLHPEKLRCVVYGVGRDRGLTAGTTLAIKAAMLGQTYEIGFAGVANVEYADDVARSFIACALKAPEGAPVYNMRGEVLEVDDMISVIEGIFPSAKGKITCAVQRNIMANDVSDAGLQELIGPFQPLSCEEGARRTADLFRTLLEEGRL